MKKIFHAGCFLVALCGAWGCSSSATNPNDTQPDNTPLTIRMESIRLSGQLFIGDQELIGRPPQVTVEGETASVLPTLDPKVYVWSVEIPALIWNDVYTVAYTYATASGTVAGDFSYQVEQSRPEVVVDSSVP